MLPQLPFSLSSAAAYLSAVAAVPVSSSTASSISLDEYFGHLIPVTNDVIFNQLSGPETGSDPGVVLLVIPVPEHPEWETFYIRDNCLMYNSWLNELATFGDESQYLRPFIDDAVHALLRSQHVPSISGNIFTGGLEEVAFDKHIGKLLDPSARVGSPAADGPPFRAAMLVKYAEWLLESKQNNGTWVADVLWPAIDLDLQWVSLDWNESSWDLWWPPVWGGSYWTASLQYRALYAGAQLSRKIGRVESTADYQSRAALILDYMQTFWNEDEEFMAETTVTDVSTGGRSGYGVAPLTVSVLNFDPTLGCDSKTFQPCSDRALSSLKVIDDAFKQLLPINAGDQPVLLGFFLEEEMFSGHPQFFSTFSAAEQLLDALVTWNLIGGLEITNISLKFFQQFDKTVKNGMYPKGSATYKSLTYAITEWAEKTILRLAEHTPDDYVLPMGIDKDTGEPTGLRGMIRSLVSARDILRAYKGLTPRSWAHGGHSAPLTESSLFKVSS